MYAKLGRNWEFVLWDVCAILSVWLSALWPVYANEIQSSSCSLLSPPPGPARFASLSFALKLATLHAAAIVRICSLRLCAVRAQALSGTLSVFFAAAVAATSWLRSWSCHFRYSLPPVLPKPSSSDITCFYGCIIILMKLLCCFYSQIFSPSLLCSVLCGGCAPVLLSLER